MHEELEIIGRLTSDPTMKFTPNGVAVTTFAVATTKKLSKSSTPACPAGWKDGYKGKNWELTKFWRITCWRGLAETTNQYLAKGREVFVKGELGGEADTGIQNPRVWSGKDGIARASYEVTARMVRFLSGREANGNGYAPQEPPPGYGDEPSEAPF